MKKVIPNLIPEVEDVVVDIDELRIAYTEGSNGADGSVYFGSLQETMGNLGYNPSTGTEEYKRVYAIYSKENWKKLRAKFKEDLEEAARVGRIKKLANSRVDFDSDCFRIAQSGLQQIKKHMSVYLKEGDAVPIKELERLSKTLAKFQVTGRLALGDSTKELAATHADEGVNTDNLSKEEIHVLTRLLIKAQSEDP